MADLISYIKQQLKAGYDINTIRSALVKYGYPQADIDAAVRQAYAEPSVVKHVVHLSPAVIITIVIVLVVAVGGLLTVKFLPERAPAVPTELLDLSADITSLKVAPGSTLEFDVGLMNLGAVGRYDVVLRYLVIDQTNKVVKTKEETVAIETRFSTKVGINLPPALPLGNYQLKVIASYNGKLATAEETFTVSGAAIPIPEEPLVELEEELVCDDGDPCTRDLIVDNECSFEPITPCCGNNICEADETYAICPADCPAPEPEPTPALGLTMWERLDQIGQKAASDPAGAAQDCSEITDGVFRDECYSKVAVASKDDVYCSNIADEREKDKCTKDVAKALDNPDSCAKIITDSVRDDCYMSFVTAGNYELCEKLTNPFLKQNCDQLQQLTQLAPAAGFDLSSYLT